MPRVRRKNVRVKRTKGPKIESNYRWCPVLQFRVFKGICEERCRHYSCSVYRKIRKARRDAEIERKKKELEDAGITRSLLLKPEDRIDEK